MLNKKNIVIATRKSALALWQANFVGNALCNLYPGLQFTLQGLSTAGDNNQDIALNQIGGKALFVKALQKAVLNKQADMAVHSIKDMSVNPVEHLTLAAICERADPRDVMVSNRYQTIADLPHQATVGTGSPRRQSQLKSLRPDLHVQLLRGNVNTRLKKLDEGQYDAIILAASGLKRLGFTERITQYLDPQQFIPAIGQGAIGVECRSDNHTCLEMLKKLDHTTTRYCVTAEKAVNQKLGGDCFTPIAAHATLAKHKIHLVAMVGHLSGETILRQEASSTPAQAEQLGLHVAQQLQALGANDLLNQG